MGKRERKQRCGGRGEHMNFPEWFGGEGWDWFKVRKEETGEDPGAEDTA